MMMMMMMMVPFVGWGAIHMDPKQTGFDDQYGKYGIIKSEDMWAKRQEFSSWLTVCSAGHQSEREHILKAIAPLPSRILSCRRSRASISSTSRNMKRKTGSKRIWRTSTQRRFHTKSTTMLKRTTIGRWQRQPARELYSRTTGLRSTLRKKRGKSCSLREK